MSDFHLPGHAYDSLMSHHSPVAVRMNSGLHRQIQVGDMLHFEGYGSILDRQKFKVVNRIDHPSLGHAISTIKGSNLSARDKISLAGAFTGIHGGHSAGQPVVSLHLEPHHGPGLMPSSIGHM